MLSCCIENHSGFRPKEKDRATYPLDACRNTYNSERRIVRIERMHNRTYAKVIISILIAIAEICRTITIKQMVAQPHLAEQKKRTIGTYLCLFPEDPMIPGFILLKSS